MMVSFVWPWGHQSWMDCRPLVDAEPLETTDQSSAAKPISSCESGRHLVRHGILSLDGGGRALVRCTDGQTARSADLQR